MHESQGYRKDPDNLPVPRIIADYTKLRHEWVMEQGWNIVAVHFRSGERYTCSICSMKL